MLLKVQINVAVASGFQELELPNPKEGNVKKYIDLWPIQMSAALASETGQDILTTNFDTYTLILQLGCILHTVPSWRNSYQLRVAVFVEYESDVEEERMRVQELLGSLRIEAEVLVFWLASGALKSYRIVVNGEDDLLDKDVLEQVEKVLEDEDWWHYVKRLRGKIRKGDSSAIEEMSFVDDVRWPNNSYTRDTSTTRIEGFKRLMKLSGRNPSLGHLSSLGVSLGMRTHRLNDDMISRHASHASSCEESDGDVSIHDSASVETETMDEGTNEDDSLIFNDRGAESNERSDKSTPAGSRPGIGTPGQIPSKKSSLGSGKPRTSQKDSIRSHTGGDPEDISQINIQATDMESIPKDMPSPGASPDASEASRGRRRNHGSALEIGTSSGSITELMLTDHIKTSRSPSQANFSSGPQPRARIMEKEDAGPSIMFAEDPRPRRTGRADDPGQSHDDSHPRSIYHRSTESRSPPACGFPAAGSIPLSFNDLPCRAQHLILNELMAQHSEDTAVIFTTLPAPLEGTYKSETDSLRYVSDLEVLCGGLPPTMLIHSNSMTVTMNL